MLPMLSSAGAATRNAQRCNFETLTQRCSHYHNQVQVSARVVHQHISIQLLLLT